MRIRLRSFAAVLILAAAPLSVRAADADDAAPALVVRLKSLDGLRADAAYFAELIGKADQLNRLQGVANALAGPKALAGIDLKRPLGAYVVLSPDIQGSTAVVLVPVADEKAVVKMLDGFNLQPDKGDDGVYEVVTEAVRVPVYFRFAKGYAFVTARDKAALTPSKLPDPVKLLPADPTGFAAVSLRADRIPEAIKQVFLTQLEMQLAKDLEKREEGEDDARHRVRTEAAKAVTKAVTEYIQDGREASLRVEVDRKSNELGVVLNVTPKPDTQLAKDLAALGDRKGAFAALARDDAALNLHFTGGLPEAFHKVFVEGLEGELRRSLEKEKDGKQREQAQRFLTALVPTLRANDLDLAFSLRKPAAGGKHLTPVLGLKLKDGAAVEKALRDVIAKAPKKEAEAITLDAEKAGAAGVHRLELKALATGDKKPDLFNFIGDRPAYFAIRPDRFVLAAGPDGLEAVREALTVAPTSAPVFQANVHLAQVATLLTQGKATAERVAAVAREVFGEDAGGNDRARLVVTGGPTLKVEYRLQAPLFKFMSRVEEESAPKKPARPPKRKKAKVADDE